MLPNFSSKKDDVRIRGYSTRVRNLASNIDIRHVVRSLTFEHMNPHNKGQYTDIGNWQRSHPDISVRLDRQTNTTAGAANLQVQVNNAVLNRINLNQNEGTTIAQVLVPVEVFETASDYHEKSVRTHFENVVRSALIQSSKSSGFQYTIVENRRTRLEFALGRGPRPKKHSIN